VKKIPYFFILNSWFCSTWFKSHGNLKCKASSSNPRPFDVDLKRQKDFQESKRTKNFAGDWIDKLKQDQITAKADIAVLVTETMPSDMERFGEKDGVWICGFHEVKSLSFVLREMILKTYSVKSSQENKGDKMELLYSYLTSNEFVQNIQRIVENYDGMINQLNSEKKAMLKIWAQREKSIWVVQENISSLFGSIKGIAGNALSTSNVLELPDTRVDE
jgi:hypothetical protein